MVIPCLPHLSLTGQSCYHGDWSTYLWSAEGEGKERAVSRVTTLHMICNVFQLDAAASAL